MKKWTAALLALCMLLAVIPALGEGEDVSGMWYANMGEVIVATLTLNGDGTAAMEVLDPTGAPLNAEGEWSFQDNVVTMTVEGSSAEFRLEDGNLDSDWFPVLFTRRQGKLTRLQAVAMIKGEETELPEYDVHIGDPIRKISESLGDSITDEFNAYVTWKDSKGNHIACTGDDWKNIYAIVSFSDDLELLDAEGLEPIEPIPQMEKWLGKTEKEFIAQYGPYHFQPGSGNYMPSYISKNGTVYYLGTDHGTIVSIHCFAIDGRFNSVYYTYP